MSINFSVLALRWVEFNRLGDFFLVLLYYLDMFSNNVSSYQQSVQLKNVFNSIHFTVQAEIN